MIDSNSFPLLPPDWALDQPFSMQSGIVSVAAGAGVNAVAPQSIISREIPAGARAYVQSVSLRIVDTAAYDQLRFALRHNGARIFPWNAISGEQIVDDYNVPVETVVDGGLLDIAATNISGSNVTDEPGASADAVGVRVIVRVRGFLLRPRMVA